MKKTDLWALRINNTINAGEQYRVRSSTATSRYPQFYPAIAIILVILNIIRQLIIGRVLANRSARAKRSREPARSDVITENELFHVERIARCIIPRACFINSIKIQARARTRPSRAAGGVLCPANSDTLVNAFAGIAQFTADCRKRVVSGGCYAQ